MAEQLDKMLDALAQEFEVHDPRGKFKVAIKQAFIGHGWVKPIMLNREESYDATKNPIYQTPRLMSGDEWYARFNQELYVPESQDSICNRNDDGESHDRFYRAGGANFMYKAAIEAAKKASGII